MRALVVVVALTGCVHDDLVTCETQLCPVDTTCIGGTCVSGDVEHVPARLRVTREYITASTSVEAVVTAPTTADVLVLDPTTPDVFQRTSLVANSDGEATADVPVHQITGLPSPVLDALIVYTLPEDPVTYIVALGTLDVEVTAPVLGPQMTAPGRTDAVIALPQLEFPTAIETTDTMVFEDIGAWWKRSYESTELPHGQMTWSPPSLSYGALTSISPHLQATHDADFVAMLRYHQGSLPPTFVLADLVELTLPAFTIASVHTVTPAQFTFAFDLSTTASRLPPGGFALGLWSITAMPIPLVRSDVGLALGFDSVSFDAQTTATYGHLSDPAWPEIASVGAATDIPLPNRDWLKLHDSLGGVVDVTDDAHLGVLSATSPFPDHAEVASTLLANEDRVVRIDRRKPVTLKATLDDGTCTRYEFEVRFVDDANRTTSTLFTVHSATPIVQVPSSYFLTNATYLLTVSCYVFDTAPNVVDIRPPVAIGTHANAPFLVRDPL